MPKPLIPFLAHFAFDAALDVQVREGFRAFDKVFAGVHWTSFGRDAVVWNFRLGRFRGLQSPFFLQTVAGDLDAFGSARETLPDGIDPDGIDALARLASGARVRPTCLAQYGTLGIGAAWEFRFYSAATGALLDLQADDTPENGSYVLWARVVEAPSALAPLPSQNAGEWSAIKVQIGAGEWACANGVSPSPGCPLFSKDGAAPEVVVASRAHPNRVTFDALARSVSASCVLHTAIRHNDGQFDVPAGATIIAGLRASPSGPQSAVWVLHADLTARLLAVSTIFSSGICECGKSDHHASDVAQAPDGTLFLLTECSLHRYDPNAARLDLALPGVPFANGGHPGGQCLRFYEGRAQYSTELLTEAPDDLGVFYYNRIMIRIEGRDVLGCGTVFHGPCFGEVFRGAWWGVRGTMKDLAATGAKVIIDRVRGGVWSGGGIERPAKTHFWRQLRRRGSQLFVFGIQPGVGGYDQTATGEDDLPICAVSDGSRLREVELPFFVSRATVCDSPAGETLFLSCSSEGNSRALRVVELPPGTGTGTGTGGGAKVCAFWNAASSEFRMTRAAFEDAGGDAEKLPAFLKWRVKVGSNGGGVWIAAEVAPSSGYYLQLDASGGALIRYRAMLAPGGAAGLPYDPDVWGLICFTTNSDGSVTGPTVETACEDAACAEDHMPAGTGFRYARLTVPDAGNPLSALNVTDMSLDKRLQAERDVYASLWLRRDSDAPFTDLSSYTQLINFSRPEMPRLPVAKWVDVVVLGTPQVQPIPLIGVGRRV